MKKLSIASVTLLSVLLMISCKQQVSEETHDQAPTWAKSAIWYQIFVERFNNADLSNDPTIENISTASDFRPVPVDWTVTPWTHNWYEQEEWAKNMEVGFYDGLQLRRFGGDLQGILDKLDYLQDLGVTALYLNPINDAPSLHKFDARNWRHVDVNFGPDPEGDNEIIASENPADPSTWKWTSADQLFLILVDELHKRDMRIILDFSWNHTGVEFWAWKDIVENQEKSEYKDWYEITSFDNPDTPENEFEYQGWANLSSLPEIKKVDITTERNHGHPYEGDINKAAKGHIYAVTERWLAPGGDVSKGIDGYRLDVADQIGMKFWRDWRKHVKTINPEAYLVGEIWWVEWPEVLMDPTPYVQGDVFDAVMFYQIYRPARYFFAKTDFDISAEQLVDSLNFQWNRIEKPYRYAMMNTAATHDAPRLLTSFANPGKYKFNAKPDADSNYVTGKPGTETYQRVKLYLMHQFTNVGAPQIWNGDEMGMWGGDDPDCRKPLWWPEYEFVPEYSNNFQPGEKTFDEIEFNTEWFEFYKKLSRVRNENPILSSGEIEFLVADGKLLSYRRFDENNEIIVLFNLEDSTHQFNLTKTGKYQDLMTGEIINEENILTEPLQGKILLRLDEEQPNKVWL
jgi:glycosidase